MSFDIRPLSLECACTSAQKNGRGCKRFIDSAEGFRSRRRCRHPASPPFAGRIAEMPTQLPAREPTKTQLLIQCGRYIAGIAVLLVAVVLFQLRLVRASHATARVGERIGGGSPVFS